MKIEFPKSTDKPRLIELWREAFGDPEEFILDFFNLGYSEKRCLIARAEDEICAALYWFSVELFKKPHAYIYGVATARAHRGKGICRALMSKAHEVLASEGFSGAILVPAEDDLFEFYSKLGYAPGSDICEIEVDLSKKSDDDFGKQERLQAQLNGNKNDDNVNCNLLYCGKTEENQAIYKCTAEEYLIKRRDYLPAFGVVQEGEIIPYLEAQGSFYVGDDFILASRTEGECLLGLELLGNLSRAQDITSYLGYKKAVFRTVADSRFCLDENGNLSLTSCGIKLNRRPFSMYHSLEGDTAPERDFYFAFAFD